MTKNQADKVIRLAEQAIDCYEHLRGIACRLARTDAETIHMLIEMLTATGDESVLTPDTVEWLEYTAAAADRTLHILSSDFGPDMEEAEESAPDPEDSPADDSLSYLDDLESMIEICMGIIDLQADMLRQAAADDTFLTPDRLEWLDGVQDFVREYMEECLPDAED